MLPGWQATGNAPETKLFGMGKPRAKPKVRKHLFIEEWRNNRGINVKAFAEKLGVDRTTLWRWETGQRRPDPATIARIAAALDLEPQDLWRPPQGRPSIDALLKDEPDDLFARAAEIVRTLIRKP